MHSSPKGIIPLQKAKYMYAYRYKYMCNKQPFKRSLEDHFKNLMIKMGHILQ